MSDLGTFGLEFENNIIFSYLKSAPSYLTKCKISMKNKNNKIKGQKCLIWVFLDQNFEKLLPYFKSAPSNLLKMSF